MAEWWAGLDVQIKAATIGAAIGGLTAVLAAVIGALVIFWQIGRQFRDAIRQNRINEALKLKLQVYEEIVAICRDAMLAEVQLSTFVRMLPMMIDTARRLGQRELPSDYRTSKLTEAQYDATMKLVAFISWIERWGIIDPRIDVFWWAINCAKHNITEAYIPYMNLVMTILPKQVPAGYPNEGATLPWTPPDERVSEELERLGGPLLDATNISGAWVSDFQVEMQNLLLGELFEHQVPRREAPDPRFITIRLDQREALIRHFSEETDWGRVKAQYERAARS